MHECANFELEENNAGIWGPVRSMINAIQIPDRGVVQVSVFELECGQTTAINLTPDQARQLGEWLMKLSVTN